MAYCQPKTLRRAREMRIHLTNAETILWSRLRRSEQDGFRFRKQHPIGPFIADFACVGAKLMVEVDGETHGSDEEIRRDLRRDAYMREAGWRVFRITNEDVYKRLGPVLEGIALVLQNKMEPPLSVAAARRQTLSPRS